MHGGVIVVVALTGCGQLFGLDAPVRQGEGIDASVADGTGMGSDGAVNCPMWTSRFIDTCAVPVVTTDVSITGVVQLDTTTLTGLTLPTGASLTTYTPVGGVEVALLTVRSLDIKKDATLRAHGTRPLVIAAWDSITVNGQVDVHSIGTTRGAGGSSALCGTGAGQLGADEADAGGGSGGGGGGAFRGSGGNGGPGDNLQNPGGAGGMLVATATVLRGGCSGGASGKAGPDPSVLDPDARAGGGAGGGAVLFTARTFVRAENAIIHAGGGGGQGTGTMQSNGGGGGGSGGMIAFEAPMVSLLDGVVAANGGGGGTGAAFAAVGNDGQDGQPTLTAAPGGAGVSCANAGANGGAGTNLNGQDASQMTQVCGGAGGGGGAGFIYVFTPNLTLAGTSTSPSAQQNPF